MKKNQKYNKRRNSRKGNYDWIGNGIPALQEELEIVLKPDTMNISRKRYDELVKKETTLEIIESAYSSASEYQFRDTVGYILGKEEKE